MNDVSVAKTLTGVFSLVADYFHYV